MGLTLVTANLFAGLTKAYDIALILQGIIDVYQHFTGPITGGPVNGDFGQRPPPHKGEGIGFNQIIAAHARPFLQNPRGFAGMQGS